MDGRFVVYYRVSTARQGESGLGLEAQKRAVEGYLNGGDWTVLKSFTEVESGKRKDRPVLMEAIHHAKLTGATLCIAKLDRLARNVAFVSNLMETGVDFVACDMPTANKLTIHIMAALAQHEAEMISQRTKDGLASIKARLDAGETHVSKRSGKVVTHLGGSRGGKPVDQALGVAAIKAKADTFVQNVRKSVEEEAAKGGSLAQIAARLNAEGIRTARGGAWAPMTVKRVLDRAKGL